jgi:hypothetical protein
LALVSLNFTFFVLGYPQSSARAPQGAALFDNAFARTL